MIELCWAILYLGIAVVINWMLGLYDKIGVEQVAWDWKTFIKGAIKIGIISGSAIGLGFIWEFSGLDLSGGGLEPLTLTTTTTAYYAFNAIKHLASIIKGKANKADTVKNLEADSAILTVDYAKEVKDQEIL
jgi:hypothetical protein